MTDLTQSFYTGHKLTVTDEYNNEKFADALCTLTAISPAQAYVNSTNGDTKN